MALPLAGKASTYTDKLEGHLTASGDTYRRLDFTAALLPKSNWHAVPFGTLVKLSYHGRSAVVKINDRGTGRGVNGKDDTTRVLDLSRGAMAALLNRVPEDITDGDAGVISLEQIEVVRDGTPLGPAEK